MKEVNQGGFVPLSEGLGSILKREREAQGYSLEAMAQKTRIQKSHLDAIEREDWRVLPAGPFVKGFVTSYAKALGVKPETVLPLLPDVDNVPNAHAMALAANERRAADLELRELPVGGRPRGGGLWIALGGLVLVGVLGAALWQHPDLHTLFNFDDLKSLSNRLASRDDGSAGKAGGNGVGGNGAGGAGDGSKTAASTGATGASKADPASVGAGTAGSGTAGASAATGAGSAAGTGTAAGAGGSGAAGTSTGGAAATSGDGKSAETATTDAAGTAAAGTSATDKSAASSSSIQRLAGFVSETDQQSYDVYSDRSHTSGPQTIIVSARYKVYIKVLANPSDLKPVYEGLLLESEKKTFSAPGDLWMVVGNAAAVNLTYNGQRMENLGKDGEKKGLGFRLSPQE